MTFQFVILGLAALIVILRTPYTLALMFASMILGSLLVLSGLPKVWMVVPYLLSALFATFMRVRLAESHSK